MYAIALDLENGIDNSPLMMDKIVEIGVIVDTLGMCEVVRILVVTSETSSAAQQFAML